MQDFKKKTKILITAPAYFDKDAIAVFQEIGEVVIKKPSHAELLEQIHEYNALAIRVDTNIDKQLLDAASQLKVIASATTGVDHIDVEYAKKKGVEVISLQGANTNATAEHAIALLLSLARKIPAAHASTLSGKWQRDSFIGTELKGKVLGVVGFGRIGREIARLAKCLGMSIIAYDPYLPDAAFTEAGAVKKQGIDELLQEADVVTLHVLLTDETRGLFNKEKFRLMKPTALLLNCSRGEVINEKELVYALQEQKIAGAALDVFATEPLPTDSWLIRYAKKHTNLILTPHIAGSTYEAINEAGLFVARKTKEFFEKK